MRVTVYTIAYNEAFMLPYFVGFYKEMLPDCDIVIYDNESKDNTADLAIAMGCAVVTYKTDGKLSDSAYLDIKNNCWKESPTDWVIVADVDEHFEINEGSILFAQDENKNIISSEGWNMVNMNDNLNVNAIDHAVRSKSYDKIYCFNKNVGNINYGPGCHSANPTLERRLQHPHKCYHYKYINPDYMVNRHTLFASRLSDENKKRGWGGHYLYPEKRIRKEFEEARKQAIKIL